MKALFLLANRVAYGLFFDLLLTLKYLIIQSKKSTLNQHKNIYPSEKVEKKLIQALGSAISYSKARQEVSRLVDHQLYGPKLIFIIMVFKHKHKQNISSQATLVPSYCKSGKKFD